MGPPAGVFDPGYRVSPLRITASSTLCGPPSSRIH